jgi:hypothetical protein
MIRISYNNGRVLQGIVLAFGDSLVRVAVKGADDTSEFRLVHQVWVSEDCEVVTLDFAEAAAPAAGDDCDPLESPFPFEQPPISVRRIM